MTVFDAVRRSTLAAALAGVSSFPGSITPTVSFSLPSAATATDANTGVNTGANTGVNTNTNTTGLIGCSD